MADVTIDTPLGQMTKAYEYPAGAAVYTDDPDRKKWRWERTILIIEPGARSAMIVWHRSLAGRIAVPWEWRTAGPGGPEIPLGRDEWLHLSPMCQEDAPGIVEPAFNVMSENMEREGLDGSALVTSTAREGDPEFMIGGGWAPGLWLDLSGGEWLAEREERAKREAERLAASVCVVCGKRQGYTDWELHSKIDFTVKKPKCHSCLPKLENVPQEWCLDDG